MKKLYHLVTIVTNTEDCVVLKVKPNSKMDLICLGCFDGNETMFRLTKGETVTCTVWKENGTSNSWYWGKRGYTCVSLNTERMGEMILKCIEDDFDIRVMASQKCILEDMKNRTHIHIIKLWSNGPTDRVCCHKDGEFYRFFKNITEVMDILNEAGYTVTRTDVGTYKIFK